MLLVVADVSASPSAGERAARLTGLALAEVRLRLQGPLPRVLLAEPDGERARTMAAALEAEGFTIVTCDPRVAPGDDDRLVARSLEWDGEGLAVAAGAGERELVLPASLVLMQRGVRAATTTEVTKKKERRLSPTRALLTGGLMLTKRVETESTRITATRDPFLLLHRRDGQRDVMIYERRIDYRFLGAALQPTSTANFETLVAGLRAWAPQTPFDDRVSRPGFLGGLPVPPAARVDLALWLVLLARLRTKAQDDAGSHPEA